MGMYNVNQVGGGELTPKGAPCSCRTLCEDWVGNDVIMNGLHSLGCWSTILPTNDHPFFNKQDGD